MAVTDTAFADVFPFSGDNPDHAHNRLDTIHRALASNPCASATITVALDWPLENLKL